MWASGLVSLWWDIVKIIKICMNILLWASGKIEHRFGIYGQPITLEYEIETIMF